MSSNRPTIKNHYRPVLHLRGFADSNGQVWATDPSGKIPPFQQTPENLGNQKLLYSPTDDRKDASEQLENWFTENVDAPTAEVLRKALSKQPLNSREKFIMARFLAAQDMRTPKARDILLPLYQRGMDMVHENWMNNPEELQKSILSDSGNYIEISELIDYLKQIEITVTKVSWFDFIIDNFNRAANRLFDMSWSLVETSEDIEFLTNDVGIVKCSGKVTFPVPYTLGFAGGRDHWIFPLNPKLAYVLRPSQLDSVAGIVESKWVEDINQQIISDARQFVYSKSSVVMLK